MRKVERKINKYLQSAKGQKETNTIISAFVTFKTEEGHDEAQNYIQKLYKELQEEQAQEIAKKNQEKNDLVKNQDVKQGSKNLKQVG